MKITQPFISIVIVNYNSGELLIKCIQSIYAYIERDIEVIVVDNNSADDSILRLKKIVKEPSLQIIKSSTNDGFAIANNKGAAASTGQYLHFLNPDTIVGQELYFAYQRIIEKKEAGVFVTALWDEAGNQQKMKHRIPVFSNYIKAIFNPKSCQYWNIGASLLIDKNSFEKIGGWPEDYFMYAEDLDFFYRAYKFNVPIRYLTQSVTHIGKGTTTNTWSETERAIRIEKAFKSFYKKYGIFYQYPIIRFSQLMYMLLNDRPAFILSFRAMMKS